MADCEPFWTGFFGTLEELDCPVSEPMSPILLLASRALADYRDTNHIAWASPGTTPPWAGTGDATTSGPPSVAVGHQGTELDLVPGMFSNVIKYLGPYDTDPIEPYDPASGLDAGAPVKTFGSDTGVFSVSPIEAHDSYNDVMTLSREFNKTTWENIVSLMGENGGQDVGIAANIYEVRRIDNYSPGGVSTLAWDVAYAPFHVHIQILLYSEQYGLVFWYSPNGLVTETSAFTSAADILPALESGEDIMVNNLPPVKIMGFALEFDPSNFAGASLETDINDAVVTLSPGQQLLTETNTDAADAITVLPTGSEVTTQTVNDYKYTYVLEELGVAYRQPDGTGEIEAVIVEASPPGAWFFSTIKKVPGF